MESDYFILHAEADAKADLAPLYELGHAAEGWLGNAYQILGEKGPVIEEFAAWVGALNNDAHNIIFASPGHLDELMETHFERSNYHIVSVYETGKAIDAGLADYFERGASTQLFDMMRRYSNNNETLLYEANETICHPVQVTDTFAELRRYFAKYPERLYTYDDRKFEELVCDILRDLGFDACLTKKSRDGGRDILAHVRNQVTSFLMFVECKRYQPRDKVGIDVVQRLHGACDMNGAHKGMIVTTSFFTKPAIQEQMKKADKMELADYERLKEWLSCR